VPDVRIAEVHPQGRYIKLRNTSETQVSIVTTSAYRPSASTLPDIFV